MEMKILASRSRFVTVQEGGGKSKHLVRTHYPLPDLANQLPWVRRLPPFPRSGRPVLQGGEPAPAEAFVPAMEVRPVYAEMTARQAGAHIDSLFYSFGKVAITAGPHVLINVGIIVEAPLRVRPGAAGVLTLRVPCALNAQGA